MIDKQEILACLDVETVCKKENLLIKWNSSDWGQGHCFKHEDEHPSLFVNKKTGQLHCKGCGYRASIFDFYMERHGVDFKTALDCLSREAGLSIDSKTNKTISAKQIKELILDGVYKFSRMHIYKKGNPQYAKAIFVNPNDKSDKKGQFFSLIDKENGFYTWGRKSLPVLYNQELLEKTEGFIFQCESEKDADNIIALGFVAVSSGGVNSWRDELAEFLQDKEIIIPPHNDTAGINYAQKVANSLRGKATSIKILDATLFGDFKGADISDWLNQGHTKEGLLEIIRSTPEWVPEEPKSLLDLLLKWNDILSLNVQTEYLLEKLIPKGSITLLFGRGGIGKTSLSMQIAHKVAEGLPFSDLQTIKIPVYFIDFENPLSILKERVEKIGQSQNLYVWHISNEIQPPRLDSKEWEMYKQLPPGLLIFDTLRASHLSKENDSQDSAIINAKLKELREAGFTILLLHHTPKGNENIYKGNTAWLDLSDHVLGLEEVKESEGNIEFHRENLYRLGVRIKTRYDPHHIFLKFNPDIKGFEVAKDPDYEKIEDIYEILRESPEPLKQKELKERAKSELDLTEGQVRKLLRKGESIAWDIQKGGDKNRALIYIPKSNRIIGQHIYSHPINQLKPQADKDPSNNMTSDSMQSLDNTELVNRTDIVYPINQLPEKQDNEPILINTEVE